MSKRILVVDDSPFIFEEIKNIIKNSEYEVAGYAKNGEAAIEMYGEVMPDIVTMDIIMPGIDGLEAAGLILEHWPDAKIAILSSLAYDDTIETAKKIGINNFIFKPFDEQNFLNVLGKLSAGN